VVLVVWSLNQEEVDVVTTVTFLGHVQRNEAVVITFVHADGWVQVFKFGDIFDLHWKCETGNDEGVLVLEIVGNFVWVVWGRIYARPDKAP